MTTFTVLMALKFIGLALLAVFVTGFIVLKLWNWLVPELFSGPKIKLKHALGLMALSFILTGGLHRGGHPGGYQGYPNHCNNQEIVNPEKNN